MDGAPLFVQDYKPATKIFPIRKPEIASGETYYFNTDSGLEYQVTFGKKKNNYLGNIINFSVLSEDFEDEYSETNKWEAFRIITTMIEIIKIYHQNHPYSNSYEFSGEFKEGNEKYPVSIRTRLYLRTARRVIDFNYWEIIQEGNKVTLMRKKNG
jgi:hypothetical protein